MPPCQRNAEWKLLTVLWEYRQLFLQPRRSGVAKFPPADIEVTTNKPLSQQPYRVGPAKRRSHDKWKSSSILAVPNPAPRPGRRLLLSYRRRTPHSASVSITDRSTPSQCETYTSYLASLTLSICLADIDTSQVPTCCRDTSKFRCPRQPSSRPLLSLLRGLYHFRVLAMSLANSPAVFQRGMNEVLTGLINVCCLCYVDDLIIFSRTWEQHLDDLRAAFSHLVGAVQFVEPTKCSFGSCRLQCLKMRSPRMDYDPPPSTAKRLRNFRGLAPRPL